MKHRLIILAVLAALPLTVLPAGAALAADSAAMAEFRVLCLDNDGDRAQTLGLAEAAGWTEMPESAAEEMRRGKPDTVTDYVTRMRVGPDGIGLLILARSTDMTAGVAGEMCAVGWSPIALPDMPGEVEALAGVPASARRGPDGETQWIFQDTASGRRNLGAATSADIKTAASKGPVSLISLLQDESTTILAVGRSIAP